MNRKNRRIILRLLLPGLILGLMGLFAPRVMAEKAPGGLSAAELESVLPIIRRHGVLGVSETNPDGSPKSMTLALRVKAKREIVFETLKDPANFYYISTLFKENNVLQEHDNSKAWSWASRHKLFSFTGTNTIALFPPRRADVHIAQSTIGSGDFTFVLHEDGPEHTIIVLSGVLDVQSSDWLIKFLIGGNPAMKQAMNVAIGVVVLKGVKAMALNAARGGKLRKHRTYGEQGGETRLLKHGEMIRLAPLLVRGQVILIDSHSGGRLQQATVVESIDAPAANIIDVVGTPANYGKAIKAIQDVVVHKSEADRIEFSWTLGFSVFGITSRNLMTPVDQGVRLEGVDGDLKGAYWQWQIVPASPEKTIVAYHSFAHVAKAGYLLEMTIKREPYLEHGLLVGSNMVMLRAMRKLLD